MNFYLRNQTKRSLWLLLSWRVVTTRTMKFQHLERAFWDKKFSTCASSSSSCSSSSSSTLGAFKRLRPLALTAASTVKLPLTPLELKSFSFSKASSTHLQHQHASGGGTRWNPTQEQIRKLESLYKSGVRTPNAQQIEKITAELMKHGRIEGKNVFYWFQNHKARERQKQKRNALLASSSPMEVSDTTKVAGESRGGKDGRSKRRSRSWGAELDQINEGGADDDGITLELFPLQPEKINDNI